MKQVGNLLDALMCLDGNIEVDIRDKSSGRNIDYLYRDRDFLTPNEVLELDILNGYVSDSGVIVVYVNAPEVEKTEPAYESRAYAVKLLREFYEEMKTVEKPERYTVGGTYYGSTELLSSVGNHLDWLENDTYTSYDYGGRTNYEDVIGVRVGGAYKAHEAMSALNKKLAPIIKEVRELEKDDYENSRTGLIYDYGTNFSVIGFGKVVH